MAASFAGFSRAGTHPDASRAAADPGIRRAGLWRFRNCDPVSTFRAVEHGPKSLCDLVPGANEEILAVARDLTFLVLVMLKAIRATSGFHSGLRDPSELCMFCTLTIAAFRDL